MYKTFYGSFIRRDKGFFFPILISDITSYCCHGRNTNLHFLLTEKKSMKGKQRIEDLLGANNKNNIPIVPMKDVSQKKNEIKIHTQ